MKFSKMAVAIDQHHGFKPFGRPPICKLQSYSHLEHTMLEFSQTNLTQSLKRAFELPNFHKSFSTPCLSLSTSLIEDEFDAKPRIEIIGGHGAPRVRALVVEVAIAMASGANPEPVSSGLGGAYILRAQNGDKIAVVKPTDEEPLAFNNPKGFAGRMLGQPGMKPSIRIGETGFRELAAYLLDHGGFAGVPPTALVKITHLTFNVNSAQSPPNYKTASLQRFVDHDYDAGDLGPSGFSVASIHRIGILDVRLLNLDRHAGNILVKKRHESYPVGAAELVPIDHGLCLPESLDDPYFEWLHWPQASVPFSESEVEYISDLDPYKDADLLRKELSSIRESSIRVLVLCTIFLKRATAAGLCLADIGEMMTREFGGGEENLSVLEDLCLNAAKASSSSKSVDNNDGFRDDDEEGEEIKMFEFDSECEEDSLDEVFKIHQLLCNPQKIRKYSSVRSMSRILDASLCPLQEECDSNTVVGGVNADEKSSGDSDQKGGGGFARSMSFSVYNQKKESGAISFGEMKEEEWELFLEVFEERLPEALGVRKSMSLLNQRLGTSCKV